MLVNIQQGGVRNTRLDHVFPHMHRDAQARTVDVNGNVGASIQKSGVLVRDDGHLVQCVHKEIVRNAPEERTKSN